MFSAFVQYKLSCLDLMDHAIQGLQCELHKLPLLWVVERTQVLESDLAGILDPQWLTE